MVGRGIGRNVCEVQAVLSFGPYQRGERALVDLEDPAVAGLVKAGYLQLTGGDSGQVGAVGVGIVSVVGVDSGVEEPQEEEVNSGADRVVAGEGSVNSATVGAAPRSKND